MKKVFVFGTGRCGTRTLHELFSSIPNVFSNHEGTYYDSKGKQRRLGSLIEFNKHIYYSANHSSDLYEKTKLKNAFDYDILTTMDTFFSTRKDCIKNKNKKFHYVDINPYSYLFIDYLLYSYPDAKFVHIVRDGRDVVKSFYKREATTYPDSQSELQYSGLQAAKPRPFSNNSIYQDWPEYSRFQKICFLWNFVNEEILNRFNNIKKENKAFLRLEDLCEKSFSNILNKFEISDEFDRSKLSIHNASEYGELEWTDSRVKFFWNINEDLMKRFGYV